MLTEKKSLTRAYIKIFPPESKHKENRKGKKSQGIEFKLICLKYVILKCLFEEEYLLTAAAGNPFLYIFLSILIDCLID